MVNISFIDNSLLLGFHATGPGYSGVLFACLFVCLFVVVRVFLSPPFSLGSLQSLLPKPLRSLSHINSFLTIIGKFSVMVGTLPYVLDSCERLSKLTEEMHIHLRPIPEEDTLRR